MEQKIEPLKTWEMQFAEIGISEDMLWEAKISSEFYEYLLDLCKAINHGAKEKIIFTWQLQLLTGNRDYYELYCVYGDTENYNPAFYALCSGSIEAYTYIESFHADMITKLQTTADGYVILASTYCALKGRDIDNLNLLVNLFQCPDICLVACIGNGWLEGIKWIDQLYPKAFTEVDNYQGAMDCIL